MEKFDKKILKLIKNRDPLTDEQLEMAIDHYSRLEELLKPHGDIYSLVQNHVTMVLIALQNTKEYKAQFSEIFNP